LRELETIKVAIRIADRYKYTHVIFRDRYTIDQKLVPEPASS